MNTVHDVTLVVEGQKIECSKRRLARRSDYFRAMFEGNFSERDKDTVTLNGVDFRSLKICLNMLNNRDLIIDDADLPLVLKTAFMLQVQDIIGIVNERLFYNLNFSSCLNVWLLTEPLNLKPLYLKAKKMALEMFNAVTAKANLSSMTFEELHQYLAHVHLVCKEFDVFHAFMEWHYTNGSNVMQLLACLDFKRLSVNEIGEMMMCKDVRSSMGLVNVLKCVIGIKKGIYVRNNLAEKLIHCNHRGYWIQPLFFKDLKDTCKKKRRKMLTCKPLLLCNEVEDIRGFWEALNLWMCDARVIKCKVIEQKQQLFIVSRRGYDRTIVWQYDIVQKRWNAKCTIPFGQDRSEICLVNNKMYILGGRLGSRGHRTMIMCMLKQNSSGRCQHIRLPEYGYPLKCCNYMNNLFVFFRRLKCGYLYKRDQKEFVELSFKVENFPKIDSEYTLYSANDRIFICDSSHLVEIRIVADKKKVHVEKVTPMPRETVEIHDKSLLCQETEYTLCRFGDHLIMESKLLYRDQNSYGVGKAKYVYDVERKMMLPDSPRLAEENQYVNTMANLFDNY